MIEITVLAIFAIALFLCIGLRISILFALVFGFFLFFAYGIYKKHTVSEMLKLSFTGIKTVKNILITSVLIGIITALWRAGGTIPFIVYYSTRICNPHAMVIVTFLLCCLISTLTGTALGTAATMGVICVAMANSMGIPVFYTGGAVLAGSYFGDRCSPMSTSALLVSTLTNTNLFLNIKEMIKTSLIPFLITCCIYAVLGMSFDVNNNTSEIQTIFKDFFVLHPVTSIPAILIIILSLFKINVKITMGVSIVCSLIISVLVQKIAPLKLIEIAVFGYLPENSEVYALLSGGGILSMKKVFFIVCISSCYAGIFNGTGMLDGVQEKLLRISQKSTSFGAILITSIITSIISCNQTLAIMLTHQLCKGIEKNKNRMASYLENTAVVIAPLIPWSIAGAAALEAVGAPMLCIATSFYLFLLPLWNYAAVIYKQKNTV